MSATVVGTTQTLVTPLLPARPQAVAVPEGTRLIRRFERDSGRVVEALRLGAAAMAAAVLSDPIELCWQPVAYRAPAVGPGEAESFAPRLDAVRRRVDAAGALVR